MNRIERHVVTDKFERHDDLYESCQASINTNKQIVLRKYNFKDEHEELIILSTTEARAIYHLFDFLREHDCLPF